MNMPIQQWMRLTKHKLWHLCVCVCVCVRASFSSNVPFDSETFLFMEMKMFASHLCAAGMEYFFIFVLLDSERRIHLNFSFRLIPSQIKFTKRFNVCSQIKFKFTECFFSNFFLLKKMKNSPTIRSFVRFSPLLRSSCQFIFINVSAVAGMH